MVLLLYVAVGLLLMGLVKGPDGAGPASGRRVLQRENANGVRLELQQLLDDWEEYGTHTVRVPSSPWGGLRTSETDQAGLAAGGMSGATTLEQTPHGRGAGLDVWPDGFEYYVAGTWAAVPQALKQQFEDFGRFAEARGFTWGGRWRWRTVAGVRLPWPNGDQPHVELANWRALPFPPPAGGYS